MRPIADKHGGALTLSNREPHGLRVSLTFKPLPVASARSSPRAGRLSAADGQSMMGQDYFLAPRVETTSATPRSAAVITSWRGPNPGAVLAIRATN